MMTQTHMIMGAALFGAKRPALAWAGLAGALIPDLPMYAIVAALKFYAGLPDLVIYGVAYFHPYWQLANGLGHSLVFWPLLAILAWAFQSQTSGKLQTVLSVAAIVAASATLHSVIDMLCHREDAHSHFAPFTMWKFISPVSYWNPAHFGTPFKVFEAVVGLALCALLFARYRNWPTRALISVCALLYAAIPAYFDYVL
jgi:hypothetical protein